MNDYMPPMAVRCDSLDKQKILPKEPQSSSQKPRSGFKQTTLSFGKKPSTARLVQPAKSCVSDVVDLSRM